MSNIVVDDTDPTLTYSGKWTLFANGSSRQWNSTIHSTFQFGATVSFQFQGSVCKVYGTVPIGNGSTVLIDVAVDGSVSPIISQTTGSAPVYADLFYESSPMTSSWHTVVITNRGGVGNSDFEFDRVELDANDIVPTIAPFPATASPSQTSPSSPSPTSVMKPGSQSIPVGTIAGIVVGGIIALLLLLLLLCHRRLKAKNHLFTAMGLSSSDNATPGMSHNHSTVASPFTLKPSLPPSSAGFSAALDSPPRIPLFSAKALREQTTHRSENNLGTVSSATPFSAPNATVSSTLNRRSLDLSPLGELPVSSIDAPHGPPDENNIPYPLTSAYPGTTMASDVPPAYRHNE